MYFTEFEETSTEEQDITQNVYKIIASLSTAPEVDSSKSTECNAEANKPQEQDIDSFHEEHNRKLEKFFQTVSSSDHNGKSTTEWPATMERTSSDSDKKNVEFSPFKALNENSAKIKSRRKQDQPKPVRRRLIKIKEDDVCKIGKNEPKPTEILEKLEKALLSSKEKKKKRTVKGNKIIPKILDSSDSELEIPLKVKLPRAPKALKGKRKPSATISKPPESDSDITKEEAHKIVQGLFPSTPSSESPSRSRSDFVTKRQSPLPTKVSSSTLSPAPATVTEHSPLPSSSATPRESPLPTKLCSPTQSPISAFRKRHSPIPTSPATKRESPLLRMLRSFTPRPVSATVKQHSPLPSSSATHIRSHTPSPSSSTKKSPSPSSSAKKISLTPDRPEAKVESPPSQLSPENKDDPVEPHISKKNFRPSLMKFDERRCKAHACLFCGQIVAKITRHLRTMHPEEESVKQIIVLPEDSAEGRQLVLDKWDSLRKLGDYHHNKRVKETGEGVILLQYHNESNDGSTVPCEHCFGTYKKKEIWRHRKTCSALRIKAVPFSRLRCESMVKKGKELEMLTISENQRVRRVLANMNEDIYLDIIKADKTLLKWLENLIESKGLAQKRSICGKVRLMAKLFHKVKDTSDICSIEKCFEPKNFDHVLQCTKLVGRKNEEGEYETPTSVLKLSGHIKDCATICQNEAIKREDNETAEKIGKFIHLFKSEFSTVSHSAKITINERKFNKVQVLPLMTDIQKLHDHINLQLEQWTKKSSLDAYIALRKYCLSKIVLFNRKRSGEVEKMLLQHFNNGLSNPQVSPHSDIIENFSSLEKELCKTLTRIEIRGKRDRKVAILLTPEMLASLKKMIEIQPRYVDVSNIFVFARVGNCSTPVEGHKLLKEVAIEAEVTDPNLFKSTKLRKHLATMSQMLEISVSDRHLLANFMGHSDQVHGKYYKLPDTILERSKVAQILIALNDGKTEYRGKAVEDIQSTEIILDDGASQSDASNGDEATSSKSRHPSKSRKRKTKKVVRARKGSQTASEGTEDSCSSGKIFKGFFFSFCF